MFQLSPFLGTAAVAGYPAPRPQEDEVSPIVTAGGGGGGLTWRSAVGGGLGIHL